MTNDQLPLSRQIEIVFRKIRNELRCLSSGVVFIQIRNDQVGKFGVKHDPLESRNGFVRTEGEGLSDDNQAAFRKMALESLQYKTGWTHGEIYYEFALKKDVLCTSVQFESNYNMANLFMTNSMSVRKEIVEYV